MISSATLRMRDPRSLPRRAGPVALGGERAAFLALVLAQVVPLWIFRWFPSQDGPNHLEIGRLLLRLGGAQDAVAGQYFALNHALEPTWLLYLPLSSLLTLASPAVAEKLLLTAFVLLFALTLRYALEGVRQGAGFLAVLGLPLVFSFPLHLGFYPFCFATVLFFAAIGYWLRRGSDPRSREVLALGGLLVLAFFAHPVPMLMTVLALGTLALCGTAADFAALAPGRWRRAALRASLGRRVLPLLLASLPALVLVVLFVHRQQLGELRRWPLATLATQLAALYSLVSFDNRELIFSIATQAVFAALAAALLLLRFRRRSFSRRDAFLAAALLALVAYFVAPGTIAGGGLVNHRLQLFVPYLLLLWFGSEEALDRWRGPISAAGAALTLGFLAVHAAQYRALNAELDEYLSAERLLPPRSTLLSLSLAHRGVDDHGAPLALRVQPFQHAAGHLAARRDLVDLVNFQASTGYFPVVYRSECDPYSRLGSTAELEELPVPRPHLDGYAGRACSIDYLLLWGLTEARATEPAVAALLREIEVRFEPVFVSPEHGLLHLYRRRGAGSPEPAATIASSTIH